MQQAFPTFVSVKIILVFGAAYFTSYRFVECIPRAFGSHIPAKVRCSVVWRCTTALVLFGSALYCLGMSTTRAKRATPSHCTTRDSDDDDECVCVREKGAMPETRETVFFVLCVVLLFPLECVQPTNQSLFIVALVTVS